MHRIVVVNVLLFDLFGTFETERVSFSFSASPSNAITCTVSIGAAMIAPRGKEQVEL